MRDCASKVAHHEVLTEELENTRVFPQMCHLKYTAQELKRSLFTSGALGFEREHKLKEQRFFYFYKSTFYHNYSDRSKDLQ